jgi:hypothetical protein
MSLTPEQKATVATWIAAGDNLSAVQKKLRDEFKVSMTYMDVRFLVDDLNLTLKDPAPKADVSDVSKTPAPKNPAGAPSPRAEPPAAKKSLLDKAKEKLGLAKDEPADDSAALPADAENPDLPFEEDALPPAGASSVTVIVDKVTLIPGAIAGGTVTFSDGVTGKWIIDQQYRPGFTEISQPGYRPSPADAQAFMQELSRQLQQRGF